MADDTYAPDLDRIENLALAARAKLPEAFRGPSEAVQLRVAEFPTDAMLADLGIEDPFDLTGLYDGIPLTEKSVIEPPASPDVIWLFRRAILDEWVARGNVTLEALVAHVLIHELAHHFGWSDADIAWVDEWWR